MKTLLLCVTCFAAGAFSVGVPLLLMLTYRPRYVAPVLPRKDRNGLREADLYDVGVEAAYPRGGQESD
ncbi:hypothetical protein [Paraburkholderia caffeinilytica]|uniref:hypothetical protein n=1 Tax=Paraburkholderia caffeinilytica TaxID=1761016 RepID=UPI0038BAA7D6